MSVTDTNLRRWIAVIGAVGAVVFVVAGALRGLDLPAEVAAAAGAATAAIEVAVGFGIKRLTARADRRKRLGKLLRLWPLPKIEEADPTDLGVFRSEIAQPYAAGGRPPYVPRDADRNLDELAAGGMTLVLGPPNSGKSRTAYEAALRNYPGARVILPRGAAELAELFESDPPLNLTADLGLGSEVAILWLDRLETYLVDGGPGAAALDALARNRPTVAVMATIESHLYQQQLVRADKVPQPVLIRRATDPVTLGKGNEDELARARDVYPDEDFLPTEGIGEHFVSTFELLTRLRNDHTTQPAGVAVLRAAVDWRRAGVQRPIPERDLIQLFRTYLDGPMRADPQTTFEEGARWADHRVESSASLLTRDLGDTEPSYDPWPKLLSYVVEPDNRLPDEWAEIPDRTWDFIVEHVLPDEAAAVGLRAYAESAIAPAEAAFAKASASKRDEVRSMAILGLAELQLQRGELEAAEAVLRSLVESSHEDVAPFVRIQLATLLSLKGEAAEAEEITAALATSTDPTVRGVGSVIQGEIALRRGDSQAAEQAFRDAIATDDPFAASMAKADLGETFMLIGRSEEAEVLFREVLDRGLWPAAAAAELNVGRLLAQRGDVDMARGILEDVIAVAHPAFKPIAGLHLGSLNADSGDPAQAEDMYRWVIESGHPNAAPLATAALAGLLLPQGRPEALELARRATTSVNPAARALGSMYLGVALSNVPGKAIEAEASLRSATSYVNPAVTPLTQLFLGEVLSAHGSIDEARALFEAAIASGHPQAAALARGDLGAIFLQTGQFDDAERELRAAIATHHPVAAPMANWQLGNLLILRGNVDDGVAALQEAIGSQNAYFGALARSRLADVHAMRGDFEPAIAELQEVATSPFAIPAGLARVQLAEILLARGELDDALATVNEALESDNATVIPLAQALAGRLYLVRDDPGNAKLHFDAVLASQSPPAVAMALLGLGGVAELEGDDDEAQAKYEAAVETGQVVTVPQANLLLGLLLRRRGDERGAVAALERAAASTNPSIAAPAAEELGEILEATDPERAAVLYRTAANSGQPIAPVAALQLAILLPDNELVETQALLLQATDGPPGVAAMALTMRAGIAGEAGDTAAARELFAEAIAIGDELTLPLALMSLGDSLLVEGDVPGAREAFERVASYTESEFAAEAIERLAELPKAPRRRRAKTG